MVDRLRFGPCELRRDERVLLMDGRPVALGVRAFDLLLALVERRERAVSKRELIEIVWGDLVVEEANLSVQVSNLRKVLGPTAIVTVPSVGYRFAMAMHAAEPLPVPPAAAAGPAAAWDVVAMDPGPLRWRLVAQTGALATLAPGSPAATALRQVVAEHGGLLLGSTPQTLAATFASAQAAAACSHRLHELFKPSRLVLPAGHGAALQIGIGAHAAEAAGSGDTVQGLAALAGPHETLVSDAVADQLVVNVDGDLQDLGHQHLLQTGPPTRVLRLTAAAADTLGDDAAPAMDNLLPTVALIPFTPYSREGPAAALGDVIADQVISALSKSQALNVVSRLSTLGFRDREASVQLIARRLAANFVVSGRYWVSSGQVHVHVEVASAASARVLWSDTIADHEQAALHADSNLVLGLVTGIVQAVFLHEVKLLRGAALPDVASHSLMLASISLMYRLSPRDFGLARQALETLHARAPNHPAPLAWLARWHLFRVVQGWSDDREQDGRLALDHANHALDLDPDSSLALTMLGNVNTNFLRDLDTAESLYDRALLVNPNESLAWLQKGNALSFAGDGAAALTHTKKALKLSPLDPARHFYLSLLAGAALTARDWDQTIEAARQSLKLNQEHVSPHRMLAIALAMTDRIEEARASVRQVMRLEPDLTVRTFVARSPGARSGLAAEFGAALHRAGLPMGD